MERARTNASGLTVELCRDTPFGMNLICTSPTDQSPTHFASLQYDPEAGKKSVTSDEGHVASRGPSERRGFGVWGCSPLATPHSLLPLNGRWLSPDWSATPLPVPYAGLADPQSLNLYAYVRGNPVSRTDPDGHRCYTVGGCLGEWINGIFFRAKDLAKQTRMLSQDPPPPPPKTPPPGAPEWQYKQGSGDTDLKVGTVTVFHAGTGYAGHGRGLNNSANEHEAGDNAGPPPKATWTIGPMGDYTKSDGTVLRNAMVITPSKNVDMTGRAPVFLFHGGNYVERNSSAGCIVLPLEGRAPIGTSGIHDLAVVE